MSKDFFKVCFTYDRNKDAGRYVMMEQLHVFDAETADELHEKISKYIQSEDKRDMQIKDIIKL